MISSLPISQLLQAMPSTIIIVIYTLIFNYALCFTMQTGVLPYLVKDLGLDAVGYAYIQTLFNIIQFLGSPIYGRFGDLYGAKMALLLSFISTTLSYFFLSVAGNVYLVVLSRVSAMFMSGMQGCQMVLSDVSDATSRASALGKLSAFYTLGLIFGSLSAGYLIQIFSTQFTAFIATFGSVLAIPLILYFIPTSVKSDNARLTPAPHASIFDLTPWKHVLSIPGVVSIFIICLLSGISGSMWSSLLPILSIDLFNLEPQQYGWLVTYLAIVRLFILSFGVTYVTRHFEEFHILLFSVLTKLASYLVIGLYPNLYWFCLFSVPLALGDALFNTISTSMLANAVPESSTGLVLGLSSIAMVSVGMVAPLVAGYLFQYLGYCLLGCSLAMAEVFAVAYISSLGPRTN